MDTNKNVLAKDNTNENGIVEFKNLPYGKYYYMETKAPKGYEIDNNMYLFEILEDNQLISNIVKNNQIEYEEKDEIPRVPVEEEVEKFNIQNEKEGKNILNHLKLMIKIF